MGNPCIARYVDPVRVESLPRGSSTLDRADGTPPPRHRALRARARRPRCRPAPRPLARRHLRYRRPVHAERPRRDQHPHRPPAGGTTTLAPSLSNDTLTGTETLTAIERRTRRRRRRPASTATSSRSRRPAERRPDAGGAGDEPAVRLARERRRHVRRHARRPPGRVLRHLAGCGRQAHAEPFNRPLEGNGIALYTEVWGPTTPPKPGAVSAILFPFPAATPNTDLEAPVVELRTGGAAMPIPPGGAVLVAVGPAAAALTAEAPVGQLVTAQLLFKPDWPDIVSAIGGGPQIVRDGAPDLPRRRDLHDEPAGPRAPRSAVGQLADGKMILVTVDGRQPGYSVGMTNFELAQALVRLGAVTGMALDSGGSATMAFDGTLLNRPSEPERPISTALLFQYTGVFVQPAVAIVSPDGDGVATSRPPLQDREALDRRGEAAAPGRHGRLPGVGDAPARPLCRPLPARRSAHAVPQPLAVSPRPRPGPPRAAGRSPSPPPTTSASPRR